ncbi:hypothetical protein K402DRAFT_309000, partial [Aulographum hederae CBS 113979]
LLSLALSAVAEPTPVKRSVTLVERDLATITGVLGTVSQDTTALGSAVNAGDIEQMTSAATKLLNDIRSGTQTVSGTGSVDITGALSIQGAVSTLQTDVEGVVSSLKSKKAQFDSQGVSGTILKQLQDQKSAADNLAQAISSKVPPALATVATTLSAGISNALQDGITAYEGSTDSAPSSSALAPSSSAPAPSVSAAPSSSVAATSSHDMASMSSSMSMATSSLVAVPTPASNGTDTPAQFTGAAKANAVGSFGALAVFAAAL